MTDLTRGFLDVYGFSFNSQTSLDDVKKFFGDKVTITQSSFGFKVKLPNPCYISTNLYVYTFNFNNAGLITNFSIFPVAPPTVTDQGYGEIPKYKLELAKRWLRNMIPMAPQIFTENSVGYTFNDVEYYASLRQDVHYGIVGGEIMVLFRGV